MSSGSHHDRRQRAWLNRYGAEIRLRAAPRRRWWERLALRLAAATRQPERPADRYWAPGPIPGRRR